MTLTIEKVDKRIREHLARHRLLVELVHDLVMAGDGTCTGKGVGDHVLDMTAAGLFGFASRPKDGASGVAIKPDGKGNTAVLVGYRDSQHEPALEKGESAQYNAFGAMVKQDKDGKILISPKAGQTAELAGNAYDLPRWNDFLVPFKAFVGAVKIATTAAQIATAAATFDETFTPANDFKSANAKNG